MTPKLFEQIVETIVRCGHVRTVEIAFEDKKVRFVMEQEPDNSALAAAEDWIEKHGSG
jgi:hypothetical protein